MCIENGVVSTAYISIMMEIKNGFYSKKRLYKIQKTTIYVDVGIGLF